MYGGILHKILYQRREKGKLFNRIDYLHILEKITQNLRKPNVLKMNNDC